MRKAMVFQSHLYIGYEENEMKWCPPWLYSDILRLTVHAE